MRIRLKGSQISTTFSDTADQAHVKMTIEVTVSPSVGGLDEGGLDDLVSVCRREVEGLIHGQRQREGSQSLTKLGNRKIEGGK